MERYFVLGNYNTWYDWDLILTAKDITPPKVKTNYVNIDGMSGTLDLTEALTGEPTFNDRTITATFWTDKGNRSERDKLLRDITIALHGRKIEVVEPDDPTHYFVGRVTIKSSKNILPYLEFSIEIVCEPWRYAIDETVRRVTLSSKRVNVVIRNNGAKTLCPTITVEDSAVVYYGGNEIPLNRGDWKISNIKLRHGFNTVGVSGAGTITFTYKEADL